MIISNGKISIGHLGIAYAILDAGVLTKTIGSCFPKK